jgi:hypothetical protein
MPDMLRRLPEGTGKEVNKKQVQDFIKEILFEKSLGELAGLEQAEMPGAARVIIKTAREASNSGDFSKFKPMLDFAFEKELRARK